MTLQTQAPIAGEYTAEAAEDRAYGKVFWRIVPFLMLCYVVAYLDRVNVGFAKLQMSSELGLSEAAYGIGAGIFFIGYFLFEVPSNIIMNKVGARV
ncbi:sugar phosphate permease [Rhizobium sp. BK591]|nr:sugar phosphate permease [Rhizobium sp. BK591]